MSAVMRGRAVEMAMRNYDPNDEDDRKTVERERIPQWMLDLLARNPGYVHWGPHEDSMTNKSGGWSAPVILPTWKEMGFVLDDLNEVVNFYFQAERPAKKCEQCDGTGSNPLTKKLSDDFYDFANSGRKWRGKITLDELQALLVAGRMADLFPSREAWRLGDAPTATQEMLDRVNRANGDGGGGFDLSHDAINRWILIETRAKRLGVWGHCDACGGHGDVFTADEARLGVVLWVLHPRKGCSRGVEVKCVTQDDVPLVIAYLRQAAERNAARFAKALAP